MIWKISDKVFWGDMQTPLEYRQHGANSLICVAQELSLPEVDCPFLRFPVPNGSALNPVSHEFLLHALNVLITWHHPVVIYCQGGCNRSAGLVFLYLTKVWGLTRTEAWGRMKALRPDVLSWSTDYNKIVELRE